MAGAEWSPEPGDLVVEELENGYHKDLIGKIEFVSRGEHVQGLTPVVGVSFEERPDEKHWTYWLYQVRQATPEEKAQWVARRLSG